ncbi:Sec-independent protein translocase protein TatB [Hwanghaeella sp.]|uniref:Sec-independent protein translocase protein TatB n=1 Tax=Hwanghaeella sp. TaxID=2605943 RepID=UPI003CCBD5FF
MFDLGWSELLMIAVITVIVVGPRELPRVLRTVMQGMKKLRSIAGEFQSSIDEMAREADLHDLKKKLEDTSKSDWEKEITDTVDPTGEVGSILKETKSDIDKEKRGLDEAGKQAEFSARDALSSAKKTEEAPAKPTESAAPAPAPEIAAEPASKDETSKKSAGGDA